VRQRHGSLNLSKLVRIFFLFFNGFYD
jgi:hypothetical protein